MAKKSKISNRRGKNGLTPREEAFARAYVEESGNASAAFRRVVDTSGWKDQSVWTAASALLNNDKVHSRVLQLQEQLTAKLDLTSEKVLREMALLGFANMLDYIQTQEDGSAYIDLSKLTREQAAAISEVTSEVYMEGQGEDAKPVKRTKFKLADKKGPLELLGRQFGLFKQQQEHTGKNGGPIQVETKEVTDLELARWMINTMNRAAKAQEKDE